jgi:hypothetical protein
VFLSSSSSALPPPFEMDAGSGGGSGQRRGTRWRGISRTARARRVSSGRVPVWRATRGYLDPTRWREKLRVRRPGR